MSNIVYIKEDLVKLTKDEGGTMTLYWGDKIEVLDYMKKNGRTHKTHIRVHDRGDRSFTGTVRGKLPTQKDPILHFKMIDVQQGDGMMLETPKGRKLFIDGGDNCLFARFAASRFRGSSDDNPLEVDAMIITHGDADHFAGLNEIFKSEKHKIARKKLFIHPKRVYHNGLVKGPSKLPVERIFGRSTNIQSGRAIIDLEENLLDVPEKRMNSPFKTWKKCLKHWSKRGDIEFRRLEFGDKKAFKFLEDEGIQVDVLGPLTVSSNYRGKRRKALPLLRKPSKSTLLHVQEEIDEDAAFSSSHTINGHSVALRLRYGNVRFFLSGDLNHQAMANLRRKAGAGMLRAEIVKVPHHGSADVDFKTLKAMKPVVWLISSGDESSRKEHIHPRASLMGVLGGAAQGNQSLVFCTELAAFFEMRKWSRQEDVPRKRYFGFERTCFGIVHIRTDGSRVLVFTHSGKEGFKEAYRFSVDKRHRIRFANDVAKR